ncbi:MAG: hypothetical protein ACM31C_07950, partial [Acidobacteriota bacterium]
MASPREVERRGHRDGRGRERDRRAAANAQQRARRCAGDREQVQRGGAADHRGEPGTQRHVGCAARGGVAELRR